MSDRERWIVYPLLMLSIGMSWRNQLFPIKKQVATRELVVVNDEDQPVVRIKPSKHGDGSLSLLRSRQDMQLLLTNEATSSGLFIETHGSGGAVHKMPLADLSTVLTRRGSDLNRETFPIKIKAPEASGKK